VIRRDEVDRSSEYRAVEVVEQAERGRIASLSNRRLSLRSPHAMKQQLLDHLDAGMQLEVSRTRRSYDLLTWFSLRVRAAERVGQHRGVH
jgi:hypothetical protein